MANKAFKFRMYPTEEQKVLLAKTFGCARFCITTISIRKWDCPNCGIHHDRDINAAINIRDEGKRIATA